MSEDIIVARRQDVDGRSLLVTAALELFAAEGVGAVSIRAVNREAGLGPASVHYHFGTKEALVEEVFKLHGGAVLAGISSRARLIAADHGPATARDLVKMLAEPYLELLAIEPLSGLKWIRLVGRLMQSDSARITDAATTQLTTLATASVYPGAGEDMIQRVLGMCFQLMIAQLAQMSEARDPAVLSLELEPLIDFLSGGLDSALSGKDRTLLAG